MKIDMAVACDYALVDQYGKLSVIGIFQHVWVHSFPVLHPRLHLVVRLKGKRTEIGMHRIRIRFVDDAGNQLINGDGTVTFAEPAAGVIDIEASAVLVFDVPLPRAGVFHFEITIDEDVHHQVPITAALAAAQQGHNPHRGA